jgi:peptidyl-prolyl cis-trans isomerase B (cyclophilin B)
MACTPAVSAPSALAPAPTGTRLNIHSAGTRRGALALRPARVLPALSLGLGGSRGAVVVRAAAAQARAVKGSYPRAPRAKSAF